MKSTRERSFSTMTASSPPRWGTSANDEPPDECSRWARFLSDAPFQQDVGEPRMVDEGRRQQRPMIRVGFKQHAKGLGVGNCDETAAKECLCAGAGSFHVHQQMARDRCICIAAGKERCGPLDGPFPFVRGDGHATSIQTPHSNSSVQDVVMHRCVPHTVKRDRFQY